MTPESVLFLNKNAGALKLTPSAANIENYVKELGLDVEIRYPDSPGDMSKQIAELVKAGTKTIIVSGGDGTVRLAAQQMAYSDSVLGILPMGTSNNFATALHLPIELAAAIQTVKDGVVTEVSLGKINDSYFTEGAGVGLFADALAIYGAGTNKNIFRGLYTLFRLFFLPRSRVRITLDDKVIIERATMCTVANSFRIGQAIPVAPEASLTDDVLDVVIYGDINRKELMSYYKATKTQLHNNLPKVTIEKAKTITLESFRGLNVHADDRVIGTTPVTITVEPRALKVLTPRL
ncbi:MAG: protein bmrU [Patescibacteria group bacterium]|jgi:YegS/Rv2252/BmrU family lipid kinase|nr:protein bmrU [Patescibacteria group bacterium]